MKYIHILVFLFILTPLFFGPLLHVSLEKQVVFAGYTDDLPGTDPLPDTGGTLGTIELTNPLKDSISSIPALFKEILAVVMIFAVPIIVFFIIYAGFLYVTAGGNPDTIKKATAAITYAVIGGLLILGAQVLIIVIEGTVSAVTG